MTASFFSGRDRVRPRTADRTPAVEPLEPRVCLGTVLPFDPGFGSAAAPPAAIASFDPAADDAARTAWYDRAAGPTVIRYDFRDLAGHTNEITAEQRAVAERALSDWSAATGGKVRFERDVVADAGSIVTIGVGDLGAVGGRSAVGGTLGVGGGANAGTADAPQVVGLIWLDRAERWDVQQGNGNPAGSVDYFTVMAHETGHLLGLSHAAPGAGGTAGDLLGDTYSGEKAAPSVAASLAAAQSLYLPLLGTDGNGTTGVPLDKQILASAQISASEVQQTLDYASRVSDSNDAIIAIVDRNGRILGVRVEQDVLDTFAGRPDELVFAIDGAVAKARTAAFFSNGDPTNGTLAPLTSRLVRFISQSTVTQREVEANPNIADPDSVLRGPGFVAPIGLGAHFPPEIANTPPVDLFGIEHTNRDSIVNQGDDGIRGTADDFLLRGRFNIDPAFVPAGKGLFAPESYGFQAGIGPNPNQFQSRGIATLPGGVPIYRDTNGDGVGESLVGGIGVFFPGEDGYATHEQNFIPGIGQTELARTNAPKVLEAEYIASLAAGGSVIADSLVAGFNPTGPQTASLPGAHPVSTFDLPFGRLDLVGIQLQVLGPTAGEYGLRQLLEFATTNLQPGAASGTDQPVTPGGDLYLAGRNAPEGWLVLPHASSVDPELTAERVEQIMRQARRAAEQTRAAVRLDVSNGLPAQPGARTRMVFAVTDTTGEVLGLFRMRDATIFSIDVAVAKARNTAYYANPTALQPIDQLPGIAAGTAFTNRTFRFVAEPRFPDGVDGAPAPAFSILNDPGIDPRTGENTAAGPAPASAFTSVLGFDAFNPMTNFRDPGDPTVVAAGGVPRPTANQNGIVFFPGSTPIYDNAGGGQSLIGGFGVSGDGVDQDDVVTFLGARGFLPDGVNTVRADQTFFRGVRLPYVKFLRNPFG